MYPPVARPDPTAREKQQVYKAKKRYNHFLKSYHHQIQKKLPISLLSPLYANSKVNVSYQIFIGFNFSKD